jgi:transcriptional regulator with XRE-family HTH domain
MNAATIPEWPLHYRLRLALDVAQLEPEDLATELGTHPNTIRNYIAGRTRPRRPTLRVISQLTGVSMRWLETGDETEQDDSAVTAPTTRWYLAS